MLTVRIFSLGNPTGLYDLERKLVWGRTGIVSDDNAPLSYIFNTLESFGLTELNEPDRVRPKTAILLAPDPAVDYKTGDEIMYHASLEFKFEADRARVCAAYQNYLDR